EGSRSGGRGAFRENALVALGREVLLPDRGCRVRRVSRTGHVVAVEKVERDVHRHQLPAFSISVVPTLTASKNAAADSREVSGRTPCPRLTICARPPVSARTSLTRRVTSPGGPSRRPGSRLPWRARPGARRRASRS